MKLFYKPRRSAGALLGLALVACGSQGREPRQTVHVYGETIRESSRPLLRAVDGCEDLVATRKAEIGAGWAKRSSEGRDYLSVKIDDPSLPAPLYARLFAEEDGKTHLLIWTRSTGRRQD